MVQNGLDPGNTKGVNLIPSVFSSFFWNPLEFFWNTLSNRLWFVRDIGLTITITINPRGFNVRCDLLIFESLLGTLPKSYGEITKIPIIIIIIILPKSYGEITKIPWGVSWSKIS